MECPDCHHEQIRERKANLIRNVKRRKLGNQLDRYVCDNCEWSGSEDELIVPENPPEGDHIDPMDW